MNVIHPLEPIIHYYFNLYFIVDHIAHLPYFPHSAILSLAPAFNTLLSVSLGSQARCLSPHAARPSITGTDFKPRGVQQSEEGAPPLCSSWGGPILFPGTLCLTRSCSLPKFFQWINNPSDSLLGEPVRPFYCPHVPLPALLPTQTGASFLAGVVTNHLLCAWDSVGRTAHPAGPNQH